MSVVPKTPISITDTASAVATGQLSARSVVDECLERIATHDDRIRAFNLVLSDRAREQSENIDDAVVRGDTVGRLAGVPIALKDNLCTRGIATTCSSRILEDWLPPYDATVVKRLRDEGAIIIGKTNLDEFAMGSSTENSAFGPTRNPHDIGRVPGGSSGGSTAAVSAGFALGALGSDTGGSVRQPAALCGVVGLKPTYGRVSRYGLIAFASSLDQIGPIALNVADAAALFEVIAGHDPLDSTSISHPLQTMERFLEKGVSGLRVGVLSELTASSVLYENNHKDVFTSADIADTTVRHAVQGIAGDVATKVDQAARALKAAGATLMPVSVPSATLGLSAYYLIAPAEASSNLARYDGVHFGSRVDGDNSSDMNTATRTAGFGVEVKRRIMLGTYALSAGYYEAFYEKALRVRTLMLQEFAKAYEDVDLLISPTAPTTAFELGSKTFDPMLMYMSDVCTIPANLTGHPAISVPFGSGDDGLPIGIQLMGPALSEPLLFQAAAVLEQAAGSQAVADRTDKTAWPG